MGESAKGIRVAARLGNRLTAFREIETLMTVKNGGRERPAGFYDISIGGRCFTAPAALI
jgi:hypothetical protein